MKEHQKEINSLHEALQILIAVAKTSLKNQPQGIIRELLPQKDIEKIKAVEKSISIAEKELKNARR